MERETAQRVKDQDRDQGKGEDLSDGEKLQLAAEKLPPLTTTTSSEMRSEDYLLGGKGELIEEGFKVTVKQEEDESEIRMSVKEEESELNICVPEEDDILITVREGEGFSEEADISDTEEEKGDEKEPSVYRLPTF